MEKIKSNGNGNEKKTKESNGIADLKNGNEVTY